MDNPKINFFSSPVFLTALVKSYCIDSLMPIEIPLYTIQIYEFELV